MMTQCPQWPPFVSGNRSSGGFSYGGYLAAYKTKEELIELCTKYVPEGCKRDAQIQLSAKCGGGLPKKLIDIGEKLVEVLSRDIHPRCEDPVTLSDALEGPLGELVPFFKDHAQVVLGILKMVVTSLLARPRGVLRGLVRRGGRRRRCKGVRFQKGTGHMCPFCSGTA